MGRGDAQMYLKKRAERTQAFKTDVEADVGHAQVGFGQKKLGACKPFTRFDHRKSE